MIEYWGTEIQVREQLECKHNWHGPCIDAYYRFYICKRCKCRLLDSTEDEYKRDKPHLRIVDIRYFGQDED